MTDEDVPAIQAIADWLIDGGRPLTRPDEVLGSLCERLLTAGVPLARCAVFVRTPHPNVIGQRLLWRVGEGVEVSEADLAVLDRSTFRDSPFLVVTTARAPLRRRLADPACPRDFTVLKELLAVGCTDYLMQPLEFSNGEVHAVAWATTAAEGFRDEHLHAFERIVRPFARVAEIHALRRIATTLLDTYVGHHSGERILAGRIRRGDLERIEAVILLTDLRDFTELGNRHPGEQVIGLLNAMFDDLVAPIEAAGGEVLKFIGDGLLAIFPCSDGRAESAAARALDAARFGCALLDARNRAQADGSMPVLRIGVGLHLGTVWYGNIGASHRLDFTAIGPAVNFTARLEGVAREQGCEIVLSRKFAAACGAPVRPLGEVVLKGFAEPEPVFAPL